MTKQKASPRHILLFAGAGYVVAMIGMNWPASRAADSHPKLVDQARVQRLQEAAKLPEADKRAMHRDLYYPDGFLPYGNLSEFRPYGKLWNYRRGTDQFFEGSNASPSDYVGAESCRECHEKQHDGWMHHAHRKMNALATKETVLGDFSGK
ncbi:MAG: hypothetical protein QF473_08365, partial [Planctomycetota bacterium]|nr:hypothetical protein [Planctomycetota bacterium]